MVCSDHGEFRGQVYMIGICLDSSEHESLCVVLEFWLLRPFFGVALFRRTPPMLPAQE